MPIAGLGNLKWSVAKARTSSPLSLKPCMRPYGKEGKRVGAKYGKIVKILLEFLDLRDANRISRLNRYWYQVANDDTYWEQRYLHTMGGMKAHIQHQARGCRWTYKEHLVWNTVYLCYKFTQADPAIIFHQDDKSCL
eukprot:jgi/Bigna1/133214/aug1.20_g7922